MGLMRNMQKTTKVTRATGLKEKKQHGDQMFPVAIYDVLMEAGRIPVYLHWHEELEILFFTEGSATFLIEGTEVSLTAGDMLLLKPGVLHGGHDKLSAAAAYRAVLVRYEFLAGMGQDRISRKYLEPLFEAERGTYVHMSVDHALHGQAAQAVEAVFSLFGEQGKGYELLVKAQILLLFYFFYLLVDGYEGSVGNESYNMRINGKIREIYEFVQENYQEKITVGQMARKVHFSEGYFCRFFKDNFHMSFMEYVNGVRLQRAERLVTETDKTMEEIAGETGFSSSNYFAVAFRRAYGISPLKYRTEMIK